MANLPHVVPIPFPITQVTIPSSNYRARTPGQLPDAIAIHIGEGSRAAIISEFQNPTTQKSSHFLVCRDGEIVQFISSTLASFCTGNIDNPINELTLARSANPNDWTISIEHEGSSTQDITPAQYAATSQICAYMKKKWEVPLDRTHIFGHREVFSKKTCPGMINVEKIVQLARLLP